MNYHEKLEEYINYSKTKNILKSEEKNLDISMKTEHKNSKDNSQFSLIDEVANYKSNINPKTSVSANNTNNNFIYSELYKYSSNKIYEYSANSTYNSKNDLNNLELNQPNFTESLAYNFRNYPKIIKECLNFEEINTLNVKFISISKFNLY